MPQTLSEVPRSQTRRVEQLYRLSQFFMNHILRTTLLFVIMLILIGAGAYAVFRQQRTSVDSGQGHGSDPTVTRLTDRANLYSVELPKDWKIVQEGSMGVQRSEITAESPDWSATTDEFAEGPSATVHYKTGASTHLHVSSEMAQEPYHVDAGDIIKTKQVVVDGEVASYHVFKTPSTAEGQLLDAHFNHKGNGYTFLFAYNPATYQQGEEVFTHILNSIRFEK